MKMKMKKLIGTMSLAGALMQGQEVVRDVVIQRLGSPATGAGPNVMFLQRSGGAVVNGAPYSADSITETTQVLADGNRIVRRNKSSFARDGQGRTRHENQLQSLGPLGQTSEPLVSVLIADPVAKVQYQLDASTKSVSKSPMLGASSPGGAPMAHMVGPQFNIRIAEPIGGAGPGPASFGTTHIETHEIRRETRTVPDTAAARNVKTEELGEKSFEGISARGQRTTLVIPAGEAGNEKPLEVVTEHWFSDVLKAPVYLRHADPRFGETVTRLANVQLGEPAPQLFEVPADYQESSRTNSPGRRVVVREEE